MYAIAFDLDNAAMQAAYPGASWQNGYGEIQKRLETFGFTPQQGSVYFGKQGVTAVTCVLAVQDLAKNLAWFKASLSDLRMLRIEDDHDLSVAI